MQSRRPLRRSPGHLIDPAKLTQREAEVLALYRAGRSQKESSAQIGVSQGSVSAAHHRQGEGPRAMKRDLSESLARKPNIPYPEQTLAPLKEAREYWAEKLATSAWGGAVTAASEFMSECERRIAVREKEAS